MLVLSCDSESSECAQLSPLGNSVQAYVEKPADRMIFSDLSTIASLEDNRKDSIKRDARPRSRSTSSTKNLLKRDEFRRAVLGQEIVMVKL